MHIFDRLGVVSQNAKVVNGIAIDWITVNLFMVVENTMAPERTGTNNVSICQDVSTRTMSTRMIGGHALE